MTTTVQHAIDESVLRDRIVTIEDATQEDTAALELAATTPWTMA